MPRLTRTQKFADLREQLSHDAEKELSTPQLSEYENRLNQVQNQAGYFNQAPGYNQYPQQGQPQYPQYQQVPPQYQQPQYVDPFVNQQPQYQQYQQPVQPQFEQPVYQQPQPTFVEPTPVAPTPVFTEPAPAPVVEAPTFVEPVQPTYVDPFTQKTQETPVVPQETPTFEEFLRTTEINTNKVAEESGLTQEELNDILAPFNDEKIPTIAELEKQEPVVENIPNQEAELLDELDIMHMEEPKQEEPAKVEYVNDTFEEVNTYNQQSGNDTIDQITNNLVDDIRHLEENEEPVFEEVEVSDEEFSNTVSMEINKVMEEVASATTQLDVKDILAPTEAEKTPNDFVADYFNNGQEQLSKTLNDLPKVEEISPQEQFTSELQKLVEIEEAKEDIVEIKNIADLEDTHDVISDTIPFVVNNDEDEEDEYYDEDEDDASNTVLNIILIVLIIILVAVLGLIVFYILKTKGILG